MKVSIKQVAQGREACGNMNILIVYMQLSTNNATTMLTYIPYMHHLALNYMADLHSCIEICSRCFYHRICCCNCCYYYSTITDITFSRSITRAFVMSLALPKVQHQTFCGAPSLIYTTNALDTTLQQSIVHTNMYIYICKYERGK